MIVDDSFWRNTEFLAYKVAEIPRCEVRQVCKVSNRWKALATHAAIEIVLEILFELLSNLAVDFVASYILTVVEAIEVFQQQVYVGSDKVGRMSVDRMLYLPLDFAKTFKKQRPFAFGEVKCFALGILKETIIADFVAKERTVYKVGVKNQTDNVGRYFVFLEIYIDNLPRRKTDNGSLLIVVNLSAIFDSAVSAVFKEQSVYAIFHTYMVYDLCCVFEIDNCYKWMICGESVQLIVGIDAFKFYVLHFRPG